MSAKAKSKAKPQSPAPDLPAVTQLSQAALYTHALCALQDYMDWARLRFRVINDALKPESIALYIRYVHTGHDIPKLADFAPPPRKPSWIERVLLMRLW